MDSVFTNILSGQPGRSGFNGGGIYEERVPTFQKAKDNHTNSFK